MRRFVCRPRKLSSQMIYFLWKCGFSLLFLSLPRRFRFHGFWFSGFLKNSLFKNSSPVKGKGFEKMPVEVFQEPIRRKYYCRHFSCAYLFFLLTVAVGVILPFFLAYGSYGFWIKDGKYFEQPNVRYKYKFLTQLAGEDPAGDPFQVFYSSVAQINTLRSGVRIPTVRTREVDNNVDGLVDGLNFEYKMPIRAGEKVKSVSTLIFFEYQLKDRWGWSPITTLLYILFSSHFSQCALLSSPGSVIIAGFSFVHE